MAGRAREGRDGWVSFGMAGKVGHVTDCFGRGGKAGKAGRGWVSLGVVG